MRKQWMGWVLLAGVCVPQMRADDASKRAKVEQLFTVMRLNQSMDPLIAGAQAQTNGMMHSLPGADNMTAEQHRLTDEYQKKIAAMVTQGLSWKGMEPQMLTLYVNAYTEQEIDGLLAFFRSPVGQTMLAKTPELTKASLQLTQERIQTLRPQLQATMEEFAKQYKAAAPAKPASPAGGSGAAKPSGTQK